MPSFVVAAFASSVVADYVFGATIGEFVVGAFASRVIGAVAGMATSAVVGGMLGRDTAPQTTSAGFTASASARTQVVRSPVANRQVIYGEAMVSGPLVFAGSTGSDHSDLHLVIALAGHEVEQIGTIYFNDEAIGTLDGSGNVTTGRFAGKVKIGKHLGSSGQSADADLVAAGLGWTTDHRLQGVAYLYVRLTYDRDVFPQGIPNIKALVKGRKVYDPRTGLTVWSDNAALCVRDYLTAAHGLGAAAAEIDDDTVTAAANVCDEAITLAAGGTENRYTCNGVVDLGSTPRDILEAMLSSMAGILVWQAGEYRLHAGAYTAPAVTLTADDLRGGLRVRPRVQRQHLFNAVRGTYVSDDNNWQQRFF